MAMWALDNRTAFSAGRSWVRDRDGAEIWLVAVRGTFDINPDGSTSVADEQDEVRVAAKYAGGPGKSSLIYDTDFPRTKLTTDIIVNGHAYAPRGEETTSVTVSVRVGNLIKTLIITGDSEWMGPGSVVSRTPCRPFIKMPITYERAYGGVDLKSANSTEPTWDPRNPIGTGFAETHHDLVGQPVPNIHLPGSTKLEPAGFGTIPGHWKPRVMFAGTYDAEWQEKTAPLLPHDFDDRFYQCAPIDQQTARFLVGGEEVELVNLNHVGSLSFNLPKVLLGFETDFGAEPVRHRANLHTVILEPDLGRVILVWHTALRCHSMVTKLRQTRIIQKTLLFRPGTENHDTASASIWNGQ